MTERIGLIGLGIMGKPMARNLLKAGFPLTVYNRTRSKADELTSEGAQAADSPAAVARASTITITIVTDSPDVEAVVLGEGGVLEGAASGSVLIDMSTISIMAGGDAEAFERCRPVFEAMGKKLVHCGPLGAGQTVKLCNQIVVGLNNLAMSECLVFAAAAGVSVDRMLEAVSAGAAGSWALTN